MRIHDLHPEAEAEFFGEIEYLQTYSPQAAARFLDDHEKTLVLILDFPRSGSMYDDPIRKISLTDHHFSLFYFISPEEMIFILAVMNQNRRPDYWKDRLQDIE